MKLIGNKLFQLAGADLVKGFIMAILAVVVTGLYTSLSATPPHLPTGGEWQTLGLMGMAAGVAYIIKNFFSNSAGQFMKAEKKTEE